MISCDCICHRLGMKHLLTTEPPKLCCECDPDPKYIKPIKHEDYAYMTCKCVHCLSQRIEKIERELATIKGR